MATRAPDRPAATITGRASHRPPRRSLRHRLDVKVSPYAYVAPFLALFCAFGLFPLIYTAWVSLHEWTLLSDVHEFIGLDNFAKLFGDGYFWNATFNTLSIGVLSTVPQLVMAIWLANMLNRPLRAQTFFRITLLLPNVTSVVAVVVIFSQLFGRDFGLVNWVLSWFGADGVAWSEGTLSSHIALSAMIMWRWTGYNALIFLAAMQAVPRELYEAATLDGASPYTQLRKITIPMIRPTIIFVVIVSTIGAMQVIAEPLLFGAGTNGGNIVTGGPDRQFQTLALYVYERGFVNFDFGYASAASWVMFAFVVVAAAVNYLFISRSRGDLK